MIISSALISDANSCVDVTEEICSSVSNHTHRNLYQHKVKAKKLFQKWKSCICNVSWQTLHWNVCFQFLKWADPSNSLSIHPGGDLTGTCACCVPEKTAQGKISKRTTLSGNPKGTQKDKTLQLLINTLNTDVLKIETDWQLGSCNRCLAENVKHSQIHVFLFVTALKRRRQTC